MSAPLLHRRSFLSFAGASVFVGATPALARAGYDEHVDDEALKIIPALMPDRLWRPLSAVYVAVKDASSTMANGGSLSVQNEGLALALSSDDMMSRVLCDGPIGVASLQYTNGARQDTGFGIVQSPDDAKRMADMIIDTPRLAEGATSLRAGVIDGGVLQDMVSGFVSSQYGRVALSVQKALWVMGNGQENQYRGGDPEVPVRDVVAGLARHDGVTVHGFPISTDEALIQYYAQEVATPVGFGVDPGVMRPVTKAQELADSMVQPFECLIGQARPVFSQRDFG